jgi:hypothetical protein
VARPCPLCQGSQRDDIARDLLTLSYRQIAHRYHLRLATVSDHVNQHLSPSLQRVIQSEHDLTSDALTVQPVLQQLEKLNRRILRILAISESEKDWPTALGAVRECRKTLEVLGKITGEIPMGPVAVGETNGQAPLTVNVIYASSTKPIVDATKPVLEAAPLPEPASSNFGRSEHP